MLGDRDKLMYERLRQPERKEKLTKHGIHHHLTTDKSDYLISDNTVEDFWTKPIISIGATSERERIVLDAKSEYLAKTYQELKKELQKAQEGPKTIEIDEKEKHPPEKQVLDMMIAFMKKSFSDEENIEEKIAELAHSWTGEKHGDTAVIPLEEFIKRKMLVCRHLQLWGAYLLSSLVQDGILPSGNIFFHRGEVEAYMGSGYYGGYRACAHAWVLYRPENQYFDAYLIDPLLCDISYLLNKNEFSLPQGYGSYDAVNSSANRCGLIENPRYYNTCSPEEKVSSFFGWFSLSSTERRKILNYEFAAGNLDTLRGLLAKHASEENYSEVIADFDRISKTNKLHNDAYAKISDENEKQQFLFGLLLKNAKDRHAILAKQTVEDLIALKKSLETEGVDKKDIFSKLANYNSLLDSVFNAVEHQEKLTTSVAERKESKESDLDILKKIILDEEYWKQQGFPNGIGLMQELIQSKIYHSDAELFSQLKYISWTSSKSLDYRIFGSTPSDSVLVHRLYQIFMKDTLENMRSTGHFNAVESDWAEFNRKKQLQLGF